MNKQWWRWALGFLGAAIAFCVGCGAREPGAVTIGSKGFTESVILGEAGAGVLRAAEVPVAHEKNLGGTRVLWNALKAGDIDAYPEYTGTIASEILGAKAENLSRDEIERRLGRGDVIVGASIGFDNAYALAMRRARAAELSIEAISDLARHPELSIGLSNEFRDRADGWPGLRATYQLPHSEPRGLDHDLAYKGLSSGRVDVIDVYATDAEVERYDLVVLKDDLGYFPSYEAVWLWRADLERRAPRAVGALRSMEGAIDTERMRALNASVKVRGETEAGAGAALASAIAGRTIEAPEASGGGWIGRLARRTLEHALLVLTSLAAAIAVAIPLGVAAHRVPRLGSLILSATGLLQTIPSLALLVLMIPLFGIGDGPAIVALFLYSLLPIVRNTHAGLSGVERPLVESAIAIGLRPWERLRFVELPLSRGAILAGIKTAAVINVGTATLGALIGAGGYGQPILTGIRLDDVSLLMEGAIPSAAMALLVQGGFDLIERRASHIDPKRA